MNAELMAVLDEGEGRSQLLEATLQEKESQLTQLTELQKVSSLRHSTCPCCCMTGMPPMLSGHVDETSWLVKHQSYSTGIAFSLPLCGLALIPKTV